MYETLDSILIKIFKYKSYVVLVIVTDDLEIVIAALHLVSVRTSLIIHRSKWFRTQFKLEMFTAKSWDYLYHATATWAAQVFTTIPGILKGALSGSGDHDIGGCTLYLFVTAQ